MFVQYTWDHIKIDDHVNLPSERAMKLPAFVRCMGNWQEGPSYMTRRKESYNYYLLYTISGQGKVVFRNKEIILDAGKLVLLDSYEEHEYATYDCECWHNVWFHIYGNGVKSIFEIINSDGFSDVFFNNTDRVMEFYNSLIPLYNSTSLSDEIKISKTILDFLFEVLEKQKNESDDLDLVPDWLTEIEPFVDKRINSKITLSDISEHFNVPPMQVETAFLKYKNVSVAEYIRERENFYSGIDPGTSIMYNHPQWIVDAVSYIEDNLNRKILISDLIHISFVSKPVFLREFRRYTGMNPKEYITYVRIKKALILSQNTFHSITEISYLCGYDSSSFFIKIFKEWTGKSPQIYRKYK